MIFSDHHIDHQLIFFSPTFNANVLAVAIIKPKLKSE